MVTLLQPRRFHLRKFLFAAIVVVGLIVWNAVRKPAPPPHPTWSGQTMGTLYHVAIANSPLGWQALRKLHADGEALLAELNRQMSTYLAESEISRFNQAAATTGIAVAPDFARVTRFALDLARRSGGAFDPTVRPLVQLWGFGDHPAQALPTDAELNAVLARVGYQRIEVHSAGRLRKRQPDVQLDLNAVAKGYAADRLADLIRAAGATNVFVEIGGDGVAYGANSHGAPWQIGVEVPDPAAGPGEVLQAVVPLSGQGIATSGDYRNFREDAGGLRTTHILDPRTGRPSPRALASVTVVAENCMVADGLATTLFVMGPDEGLAWMETQPGAEAMFITRDAEGRFVDRRSSGFVTTTLDEADHPE